MNYLISLFIDDEMNLDEKITFVETVYGNEAIKNESVDLLKQEKQIRSRIVERIPEISLPERKRSLFRYFLPVPVFAVMVLAVILFTVFTSRNPQGPDTIPHRFVIYKPDISRAEITGSFSDWQPIPMTRLGSSGYWEAVLDLPRGEYRFSYILDGEQGIPDPTILTTENDDFGGKNSILYVSA